MTIDAEAEKDRHANETDHRIAQMEDDDGNWIGWTCLDCDETWEFEQ
jgi:hypothetical protein